jgi:hypothetical protein
MKKFKFINIMKVYIGLEVGVSVVIFLVMLKEKDIEVKYKNMGKNDRRDLNF